MLFCILLTSAKRSKSQINHSDSVSLYTLPCYGHYNRLVDRQVFFELGLMEAVSISSVEKAKVWRKLLRRIAKVKKKSTSEVRANFSLQSLLIIYDDSNSLVELGFDDIGTIRIGNLQSSPDKKINKLLIKHFGYIDCLEEL